MISRAEEVEALIQHLLDSAGVWEDQVMEWGGLPDYPDRHTPALSLRMVLQDGRIYSVDERDCVVRFVSSFKSIEEVDVNGKE